jgi:uncharacterized membrane protein
MRARTQTTIRVLRWLGIAAVLIGYSILAHHTYDSPHRGNLSAVLAIVPALLIALVLAWRSPQRAVMLGALALALVALWAGRSALAQHADIVYWVQYVGIQLVLFITFARTLVAGKQPLVSRFAEVVHSRLTPRQEAYTRKVTIAWTIFFAAMAIAATLLFFLASLSVWSFFAHFLTLPLVVLMFIAEYWVRRRALPDMRHQHILVAVRLFRNSATRQRH